MINRIHLEMIKLYRGDPKRIQHFCKVHSYAKLIAETERVDEGDVFVIEIAALTHDTAFMCVRKNMVTAMENYRSRKDRLLQKNC